MTNNKQRGTHWVFSPQLGEGKKTHWVQCLKPCSPNPYSARLRRMSNHSQPIPNPSPTHPQPISNPSLTTSDPSPTSLQPLDERQITHLICARLKKHDRYDFFRGCFWPFVQEEEQEAGPKTPLKKSYRSYFRRAQIRWVIWRSSNPSRSPHQSGVRKRVVSKRLVLADVPRYQKPGTRVHSEVPCCQKWEGTCGCSPIPKEERRAHSPKPPFYETALLFFLSNQSFPTPRFQLALWPNFQNPVFRRESSGGIEWLEVWNCIFSGPEFSNFGAWNLAKVSLSAEFQAFSWKFRPLINIFGLWRMAIPYATNPYPH